MAEPRRIQLKRTKGWKMPENTVKVDRSTRFGNPWSMKGVRAWLASVNVEETFDDKKRAENLVYNYRLWVEHGLPVTMEARRSRLLDGIPSLRGKNLACWCKLTDACHADVLLELANPPAKHGEQE